MARPKKGWTLYLDRRRKLYYVRFTHEGQRHTVTTGQRDPGKAATAAARTYAEVVSGRRAIGVEAKVRGKAPAPSSQPFLEVAALWLADIEPSLEKQTYKIYENIYVAAHFDPFFVTIDRLTSVGVEDYISCRLKQVQRETVKKELTALRRFAKWAFKRGHLAAMPEIEVPSHLVLGTRATKRKAEFQVFTESEIESVLAHLPIQTKGHRAPEAYPVRARFEMAWETALRPATLDKLRAPDDYRKGAKTLVVRDEADKTRFGRELPLTDRARASLDSVCPAVGIIFGKHDHRPQLRRAAKAAGIDKQRADRISDYDFRHSRLTFLGTKTDNLSGVMYLAGHKQPATTARYLRPQRHAAAEVLEAVQAAAAKSSSPTPSSRSEAFNGMPNPQADTAAKTTHSEGGFRLPIGCASDSPSGFEKRAPETKNPESPEMIRGSVPVRGGGIEPPWLLTASTSS
jgi:integrase